MNKFSAKEASKRYAQTDFRRRDADTPYPELWGYESGYAQAIMDVFDGAQALRVEAEELAEGHPSKDCRAFAQSFSDYFGRMFEGPQGKDLE